MGAAPPHFCAHWDKFMRVNLKIVGDSLSREVFDAEGLAMQSVPFFNNGETIEWAIERTSADLVAEDLMSFSDQPTAILVDGQVRQRFDQMQSLERQTRLIAKDNPSALLIRSPIIMILPSPSALANMPDFHEAISDWVYAPVALPEIARRVVFSLKRHGFMKARLHYGGLTIFPETRQATYEDRSCQLTPSEFMMLELFLGKTGAVMPLRELISIFKSFGKSAEPNNIRVAIFQLRLKLSVLTKSQITLSSVHRQGYCLRQGSSPASPALRTG